MDTPNNKRRNVDCHPITRNSYLPASKQQKQFDRLILLTPPLDGMEMLLLLRCGKYRWTLGSAYG